MAADRHIAHRDVLAQDRMDLPHRRVDDGDAIDEDVATAVRLDEIRPEPMAFAENPLAHRHAASSEVHQSVAGCRLFLAPFATPVPPVVRIRLTVERSSASN